MPRSKHRHQRPGKWRSLFLWHRYIGLTVSLLVLILVITGVALNHTETLRLDQRQINSPWLLDWYGIKTSQAGPGYDVNGQHITQVGERIYLDTHALTQVQGQLRGAVRLSDMLVLLVDTRLLLLTPQGEQIDQLSADNGLPGAPRQLGTHHGHLAIQTAQQTWLADDTLIEWQPLRPANAGGNTGDESATPSSIWSSPAPLPEVLKARLSQLDTDEGLPLERVVLDLHSGRLFGSVGVWVMDIAALMMAMLALSGIWIWASQKLRRRRQHRQSRHRHQRHAGVE